MAQHTTILFTAAAALLLILPLLSAGAATAPAPVIGIPGCETKCGNMTVPYPFGMGQSYCYLPGFNLTCNRSSNPPRLLIGDGTLRVSKEIFPGNNVITVVHTGYINTDGSDMLRHGTLGGGLGDPGAYELSGSGVNELILVGCDVRATLKKGNITISSCSSFCPTGLTPSDFEVLYRSDVESSLQSSLLCSGMGCCQVPIIINDEVLAGAGDHAPITSYDVELESLGLNRSADQQWLPLVFVARKEWFSPYIMSHQLFTRAASMEVPFLVEWLVMDGHHDDTDQLKNSSLPAWECPAAAALRVCRSNHTECNRREGGGYTCSCKKGYDGNPYLTDGCQDINECEYPENYGCFSQCTNTDGSFQCRPPALTGDCITSCGNVTVPFPFGIGPPNCYLPGFNLTCDTSHSTPQLMLSSLRVVDISLQNSAVHLIYDFLIMSNNNENVQDSMSWVSKIMMGGADGPGYSLSTSNELIVIGCGVQAGLSVAGGNQAILSGCSSICATNVNGTDNGTFVAATGDGNDNDDDQYCYGKGCCRAHISMSRDGMPSEHWMNRIDSKTSWDETGSPYTFIAEEGWFYMHRVFFRPQQYQTTTPYAPPEGLEVPIILEWEILQLQPTTGSRPLASVASKKYVKCPGICRSDNSLCKPSNRGYRCYCSEGYNGNPYLVNGCKGGRKSFKGLNVVIGVASGVGIVFLVLGALFISKKLKHRRAQITRRKFFEQNRGQLLQQLVSQKADITERMIISLEELEKATNNFDKARELGGGGHGTVYKGILSDLHVVAIKKPKKVVQKDQEIREFINEVAILSQINHRNVVKLYGCCLETEVPILIYEFISNGTLYEHLHAEGPKSLFWDDRLRIATEAAKSLAYLHSASSTPIIHRDVKSANILLDDTLTAKVADFGASRYIPMDLSGITTRAQGTRGYWDPTYFYTGRLTEKSDVYSFGVVLVELLTREKPFSYLSTEDESLVAHFAALFERGQLLQILDPQVIEEGGKQVEEVASIAVACIKLGREDRPTMRQVELMLEGTRASMGQTSDNASPSTKVESNTRGSIRRYSMELEFRLSAEHPR